MSGGVRLGIDIGGTKTAAALVDSDGTVVASRSAPSGRGPAEVVEVAVRQARELLDEAGARSASRDIAGVGGASPRPVAVGACMPGLVDPATGRVRHAVNLGVESLDLAGELGSALGVAVAVENDVKAASLGAWRLRADSGSSAPGEALAYLNLGTGLASAVVRDGVVVRGIDGAAGEIGHLPIGGDAPCTCGQVGCLETVASGSALSRLWPESRRSVRNPFVAAGAGDVVAAAAVDVLCTGVGLAIQLLALASGAEHIVIGGGLSALGEPLQEGIRADLARRARASQMVAALDLPDRFELLDGGMPVAALGAAWLGWPVGAGPAGALGPAAAAGAVDAPVRHQAVADGPAGNVGNGIPAGVADEAPRNGWSGSPGLARDERVG
ncbi:ROK family protein [Monashia sp. NPDC004114]